MSLNLAISQLTDIEFRTILSSGRRSSVIYGIDFESIIKSSYRFVKKDLPYLLQKGDFDGLVLAAIRDRGVGIFDIDIEFIPVNELMAFVLWLKDEAEKLIIFEREKLHSNPDPELFAAGINELAIFGDYNVIDALSGGDITKHKQIWDMSYEEIFEKQLKNIIDGRISKKINENRQKKQKKK